MEDVCVECGGSQWNADGECVDCWVDEADDSDEFVDYSDDEIEVTDWDFEVYN